MTSHATSTYTAPHVVCLMSQVASDWYEVVCWYKCVTVRSCEQLLHWRRDFPSLTERFPSLTHPVVPVCGIVWIGLVSFCSHGEGRPGTCILHVLSQHLSIHTCLCLYWCIAGVTWRPEQALLMPIIITCISATTSSQNVSCRQCLHELAKNTKHHCRTACQSNPLPTPTQKEWLVYKPLYGVCHSRTENSVSSAHAQTVGTRLSFLAHTINSVQE